MFELLSPTLIFVADFKVLWASLSYCGRVFVGGWASLSFCNEFKFLWAGGRV